MDIFPQTARTRKRLWTCSLKRENSKDILHIQTNHDVELVKIAGYMHDIGNAINRTHHAEYKPKIEKDSSVIALDLQIDESICFMYDYFESFLGRMML